jgi:3-dehydroquinate synthase
MADERDTGIRRILNFGHTVGHAIEAYTNYGLPHGRAVSVGMAAETVLSAQMAVLPGEDRERILRILRRYNLPTMIPSSYDAEKILGFMMSDKKNENREITVILPTAIGNALVRRGIPGSLIKSALREVQG